MPIFFMKKNQKEEIISDSCFAKQFCMLSKIIVTNWKEDWFINYKWLLIKTYYCRTQEGPAYTWVFNFHTFVCLFVCTFVSLDPNLVNLHSLSLRSQKFKRDAQPLGTKKITHPLGTKKMQTFGTKKIPQPLGTKTNPATSWDKKNPATCCDKKSRNL